MSTKIEYNGSVVATIENGNKATLPIKDLKMKSDIVVTVPEATDSPLPIEVSTEAEMTALLESGEVGGVYKYTGTSGTYENGALYVLEEEEAINFTIKTCTNSNLGSKAYINIEYTQNGVDKTQKVDLSGSYGDVVEETISIDKDTNVRVYNNEILSPNAIWWNNFVGCESESIDINNAIVTNITNGAYIEIELYDD